jgi:hypothetical protein
LRLFGVGAREQIGHSRSARLREPSVFGRFQGGGRIRGG